MTNVRKKNTTKESYTEADDYKKMITSIDETWPLDNSVIQCTKLGYQIMLTQQSYPGLPFQCPAKKSGLFRTHSDKNQPNQDHLVSVRDLSN